MTHTQQKMQVMTNSKIFLKKIAKMQVITNSLDININNHAKYFQLVLRPMLTSTAVIFVKNTK